jgi:hypothetical protein
MTRRLSAKVQQIPKPVVDDKRRSFEEWLKISADNVYPLNLENQCEQYLESSLD